MLAEIFLALIGHSGDIIGKDFKVSITYTESSLISYSEAENINRLTCIGALYVDIKTFVNVNLRSKNGGTLYFRGLCNGLKELLNSYHEKVCYIEQLALRNPKLTVGKVKFYLADYFSIFRAVVSLLKDVEANKIFGGKLLQLVHYNAYYLNSDPIVTSAFERILTHCHLTWVNMVEAWMCHGLLIDPYEEFFVKERTYKVNVYTEDWDSSKDDDQIKSREYQGLAWETEKQSFGSEKTGGHSVLCEYEWKSQFTLRTEMLPSEYIKINTAEKILFIGKAVRVLQRVRKKLTNIHRKHGEATPIDENHEGLEDFISSRVVALKDWCRGTTNQTNKFIKSIQIENEINDIYAVVAKRLWKLVVYDAKLIDHLDMVRQFFLLGQGEFFRSFVGASRSLMAAPPRPSLFHAENAIRAGPWREASVESGVEDWPEFRKSSFKCLQLQLLKANFSFGTNYGNRNKSYVRSRNSSFLGQTHLSGIGSSSTCANVNVDGKLILVGDVNVKKKGLDDSNDIINIDSDHGGVWYGGKLPIERGFESSIHIKRNHYAENDDENMNISENKDKNISTLSNSANVRLPTGEIALVIHHDVMHGPTALDSTSGSYGYKALDNSLSIVVSFTKKILFVYSPETGILVRTAFPEEFEECEEFDLLVRYELEGEQRPKWVVTASLNEVCSLQLAKDIPKLVEFERGSGRAWVGIIGGVEKKMDKPSENKSSISSEINQHEFSDEMKTIQIIGWRFESRLHGEQSAEFDSWRSLLSLNYKVDWPIQLVLTQASLECYSMVFQFLLAIKRVENALKEAWATLNQAKFKERTDNMQLNMLLRVRACMEFLTNNLQYHLQVDVVDALSNALKQSIANAPNFELVVQAHEEFVDKIITQSFLHNKVVRTSLDTVLRRCLRFCGLVERYARKIDGGIDQPDFNSDSDTDLKASFDQLAKAFTRDATFLYALLTRISSNLLLRIDFNGYFSNLAKGKVKL